MVPSKLFEDCGDEDYIDMELSPSSPQSREFEFQMCKNSNEKESSTCTADELFHNGKLIPLHLLHLRADATASDMTKEPFKESAINCSATALFNKACDASPRTTNINNTSLDSCNISPSESCRVSCELDLNDHFFEWSTELSGFVHRSKTCKNSWSKKLKLMSHSVLTQKLKSSRAYLKSLFNKSACSDDSFAKLGCNAIDDNRRKKEECLSGNNDIQYLEISKKKPFEFIGRPYPTIVSIIKNGNKDGIEDVHRRSFSGAIKRHSSNSSSGSSSSSSSFSLKSNGLNEVSFLRRSSSATEIEGSIEAAIAHCKKSQQAPDSRKDSGICLLPNSQVVDEENPTRTDRCSI